MVLGGSIDTQKWRIRQLEEELCSSRKADHEKTEEEKLQDMKQMRRVLLSMNAKDPTQLQVERMLLGHGRTFSTETIWDESLKFDDYEKRSLKLMYTVFNGAEEEFIFSLRIESYNLLRTAEEFTRTKIE